MKKSRRHSIKLWLLMSALTTTLTGCNFAWNEVCRITDGQKEDTKICLDGSEEVLD